ncbi:MAG TPA: methyltransferase domain-containing protein [Polyangia bacterium]|nr:methyltransferase domain-containing protein [Polyangia bacterium]
MSDAAPLVCLACRARTERGRELYTLSRGGDELVCDNEACRRRYPIVDGIPIVAADPAAHLERWGQRLVDGEPETLAEHLSIYLDAHWGDRATPPPDGPAEANVRFGMEAIAARLRARAAAPVERAVELGCGVGRGLAELAGGAREVVGVDAQLAALERARRILDGETLEYARRVVGRHYTTARIAAAAAASSVPPANVSLVCGDAMDPPLVPQSFDRVVAVNVLDAVSCPPQIIAVADGLCAPGGEIILASPYAWQAGIVADEHRFGGADPADHLRRRLSDGDELEARYTIEDEAELPWSLRRDARSAVVYRVHWLRARKSR